MILHGRRLRVILRINATGCVIRHIAGKENVIADHLSRGGWVRSLPQDGDIESNPGPTPPCQDCPFSWIPLAVSVGLLILMYIGGDCYFLRRRWLLILSGDVESNPGPTDCSCCSGPSIFMDRDVPTVIMVFLGLFLLHIGVYLLFMLLEYLRRPGKIWGGKTSSELPDILTNFQPSQPQTRKRRPRGWIPLIILLLGIPRPSTGQTHTISPASLIPDVGIRANTPVQLCQLYDPLLKPDEVGHIYNHELSLTWNTKHKTFILPEWLRLPNTTKTVWCIDSRAKIQGSLPIFRDSNVTSLLTLHLTRTSAQMTTYVTFYFKMGTKERTSSLTLDAGRIKKRRILLPIGMHSSIIPWKISFHHTYINQDVPIIRSQDILTVTHEYLQNKWNSPHTNLLLQTITLDEEWFVKQDLPTATGELLSTNYVETNRELWECDKTPYERTLR